jgi:hypothetical protein
MLTNSKIKAVKADPVKYPKGQKIADSGGLHLFVSPKGAKVFRFRYRIHGREKLISLGAYPDVKLAEAREKRSEMRRLVAKGIDPSEKRQAEKRPRPTRSRPLPRNGFPRWASRARMAAPR